jgi:hypothetical protein
MTFLIACLLWLNAIIGGTYTQQEVDSRIAVHSAEIQAIQNDAQLRAQIEATTNPSIVITIPTVADN